MAPDKAPPASELDASNRPATPLSQGSASFSTTMDDFQSKKIREILSNDLKGHSVCEDLPRFLAVLLGDISKPGELGELDLEGFMKSEIIPCVNRNLEALRPYLNKYCEKVSKEQERYPSFARLANGALDGLAAINSDRFYSAEEGSDALCFQRHDKKSISGQQDNKRLPDFVNATQRDIDRAFHGNTSPNVPRDEGNPKLPLSWESVLYCWDLKRKKKDRISAEIPTNYQFNPHPKCGITIPERDTHLQPPTTTSTMSGSQDSENPQSGDKRKATDAGLSDVSAGKNARNRVQANSEASEEALQIGDYAAEMFVNQWGRTHLLNFLVQDNMVEIWYYDKQNAIRVVAFDFIAELPYFFLLLFILQRGRPKKWGFLPVVRGDCIHVGDKTVRVKDWKLHHHYALFGRATRIISGVMDEDRGDGVRERKVIVKLSFPEASRRNEASLIRCARERCKLFPEALECLPEVLHDVDFPDMLTSNIRNQLALQTPSKASRLPRIIILPQYASLTSLTGPEDHKWEQFMAAFWKLVCCHATLWSQGIEHGDISVGNLLYDSPKQTPKLCDFDLAHVTGDTRPAGFVNTGTWRFMASELLTSKAMSGQVARLYRHDLESFGWVLIWILSRFRKGFDDKSELDGWATSSAYQMIQDYRDTWLNGFPSQTDLHGLPHDLAVLAQTFSLKINESRGRVAILRGEVRDFEGEGEDVIRLKMELEQWERFKVLDLLYVTKLFRSHKWGGSVHLPHLEAIQVRVELHRKE